MGRKAGSGRVDPDGGAGRAPRRIGTLARRGLLRQSGHVGQVAKAPAITLASMASGAWGSRVSLLRGFVFAAVIDCGERHARSASVGAALGSAWPWPTPPPEDQGPHPYY